MRSITDQTIKKAAAIIRRGGLVAFPTETVYGLGADALNKNAVARLFEVKERPFFDPLIVHVSSISAVEEVVAPLDRRVVRLMEQFWPGPLTLVLTKSSAVPEIVTAGLPTVAVRMPAHPAALKLIRAAERPIAAPSANKFGRLSPTTAAHVEEQLGVNVEMILDGGPCPIGVESTVVELISCSDRLQAYLLRPGGLSVEELEEVITCVDILEVAPATPHSPGQLLHHYAPQTPLRLLQEGEIPAAEGARMGLLAFKSSQEDPSYEKIEILSPTGDLREAAANLFACLHRLDRAGLDLLYAEPVPTTGLGRAIMNRLRKAAVKRSISTDMGAKRGV